MIMTAEVMKLSYKLMITMQEVHYNKLDSFEYKKLNMNESVNSPPLSSYRMGNQMVQEEEAVLNYEEKIILIRRTYFMMLL